MVVREVMKGDTHSKDCHCSEWDRKSLEAFEQRNVMI